MSTESVSFRISRSAQDLAETIHALSQRLVLLEQRLAAMEQRVDQPVEMDPRELSSLDRVGQLLNDCRQLLGTEPGSGGHGDDGVMALPVSGVTVERDDADLEAGDGEGSDAFQAA